ncbi:MAG: serine/threonine protein kinase, partial [Deltaproteobacteria bacterium]|nr:serine/threonine protein kinase [Kofleriaceae bacterium]
MFAGTMVGQYRITGTIGRGGMGAVYAAEHTLIGRVAAVKLLLPELSQNQEIVTRFFNEARAATAIRHPGIVEIYDFGFHADGSAYIVMEYLQGEPLASRMARGRMAAQPALAIIRQMAGALAAAHQKGIVHRDLKPDNVFLVPDPEVPGGERIKLLDFGIAKLANDGPNSSKTRTGSVMGTPTYMSPEQCRGVGVDHRADLYSLGCMLFELCTGRPPFVGEGVGDVLAAHIHVPPPSVQSIAPDVPHELEVLVQRLLVKDPAQRMQSCEELIHAVDLASGGAAYRTGPRAASHGPPLPTSPAIP